VGAEFEVSLPDQPAAGYRWVVDELPDGVALLAEDAPAGPGTGRLGEALPRTFRLQALAPGSFVLTFRLVRPWEPAGTAAAQVHVLEVTAVGALP